MKDIKTDSGKILLIGIGNYGRGDDGLGWNFTDLVKEMGNEWLDVEYRYQLQIEDSSLIGNYGTVIFADASQSPLEKGFTLKTCQPATHYFFSSHLQSPETILYLASELFGEGPKAFVVAIEGNYWELKTGLTAQAEKNLQAAFAFFVNDFLPTLQPGAGAKMMLEQ